MIIGVFDSGVGGLWILKHTREEYPQYNYIYVADQAHMPYGQKSIEEIRIFSEEITNFLISKGCKIIVIACNTATSASIKYLRNKFPDTLFVGMEPALKPAVSVSQIGKVGILATEATLQGDFYNDLIDRFGKGVEIYENSCIGLVEEIEKGEFDSKEIKNNLESILKPMVDNNIDTIVLGCTHYTFIIKEIKEIVGKKVNIIDPTPSIISQIGRIINENNLNEDIPKNNETEIFTTGDIEKVEHFLSNILKEKLEVGKLNLKNL